MIELHRSIPAVLWIATIASGLALSTAFAEVIYLTNGDVVHGTVVGANANRITLKTPYGNLVIPKRDIERIDYAGAGGEMKADSSPVDKTKARPKTGAGRSDLPLSKRTRPVVTFEIRGTLFWYAFESPPDNPTDLSLRLTLYVGDLEAATLVDSKPDTVDGNTYFNSFDISTRGLQVLRTGEGFDVRIQEAEKGSALLTLDFPEEFRDGQHLFTINYSVNEGTKSVPRWVDVVSRTIQIHTEVGKESYIVIEQDAGGLDYSGFFRKTMKGLESFDVGVVGAEMKDVQ